MGCRDLILKGLLAPVEALLNPRRFYTRLRKMLSRHGIYVTASIYFGAWIGASITLFFLILLVEAARSLLGLNPVGLLTAPFRALVYSFLFPIVPALVDAIIIMIFLAPFDRDRPLYDVFAVRASSLLPYTLRVAYLELKGLLTIKTLAMATTTPIGLTLLLIGAMLTAYGLRRTLRAPTHAAIIAGLAPLAYKIALALT